MSIAEISIERARLLYEVDKAKHDLEVELGIREPRQELTKQEFMACVRRARRAGVSFLHPQHFGACACIGPKDNEPVCPCSMRSMTEDNKYAILLYLLQNVNETEDEHNTRPDFAVHLSKHYDPLLKVSMIKLLRSISGEGLIEAKQKIEAGGTIFMTKDFFKASILVNELDKLGVYAWTE